MIIEWVYGTPISANSMQYFGLGFFANWLTLPSTAVFGALPVISADGVHSAVFGKQVVNG